MNTRAADLLDCTAVNLPADDEDGTLSVPVAGKRYFDLSERSAYKAAERGEIPTVRVGNLLRVPKLAVRTMFIELGKRAAERAQQTSADGAS